MNKKIFPTSLILAAVVLILTTAVLTSIFYDYTSRIISNDLRAESELLAIATNQAADSLEFLQSYAQTQTENQLTLMDEAGLTLFDSRNLSLAGEANSQLPEVLEAILSREGSDRRRTAGLYQETYYNAVLLKNEQILRLARTAPSQWGLYLMLSTPLFILALLYFILCFYLSKNLTERLATPINSIELSGESPESFDELAPLFGKIARQNMQIREQLRIMDERAKTLQAITEDMQEGLLLLDAEGLILSANLSALRLLGDPSKEYAGRHILQLTRNMPVINQIKDAFAGQSGNLTLSFGHKTIHVFVNPVFDKDDIRGAILLFLDITERANAEQIRREFSANVSHELKTPLTSILGYSEIISSGMSKGAEITTFAGKINTEIKRLIVLINDIIKLSELDESTGEKHLETFDLLELAQATAEELAGLAAAKEVNVAVDGTQLEINANRSMVGELIFNLLDNGIKNNRPGGLVQVSWARKGKEVAIQVRDTGIGIDRSHLDRVFERFYQVDKSRSQKAGGTGLGLSIVKHIAQYHNGYAAIESQKDRGTTVTATLRDP